MESCFGTLKTELIHQTSYPTREAAKRDLFAYIEGYYNRQGFSSEWWTPLIISLRAGKRLMGTARRQFTEGIKREALGLLVTSGRPLRRILRGWPKSRVVYGKFMRHVLMCAQTFMNRTLVCAQGERDVRPTKGARPPDCRGRVIIESVYPELDGGRHPVKRVIGDVVEVSADIFTDGHDKIAGDILFRAASEVGWQRSPLRFLENDRWSGSFTAARLGLLLYNRGVARSICFVD
jgi:hypothetical protein